MWGRVRIPHSLRDEWWPLGDSSQSTRRRRLWWVSPAMMTTPRRPPTATFTKVASSPRWPDGKIWALPFLGLRQGGGCGGAIQGKEGIKFCSVAYRSHSPEARRAKHIRSKNLAIAIWQPCRLCLRLPHCRRRLLLRLPHSPPFPSHLSWQDATRNYFLGSVKFSDIFSTFCKGLISWLVLTPNCSHKLLTRLNFGPLVTYGVALTSDINNTTSNRPLPKWTWR